MNETERRFAYQAPTGMLKVLGVLMVVMGPIAVALSLGGDVKKVESLSSKFMFTVEGPLAPWVLGGAGVLLVFFGGVMVRAAYRLDQTGGRIAIMPHYFVFSASQDGSGKTAISYQAISQLAVQETRGRRMLTFRHPGGKVAITASQMQSCQEFDEMCGLLKEHVEADTAAQAAKPT